MAEIPQISTPTRIMKAEFCPSGAGVGLRPPHWVEFSETRPQAGFLEVHPENHFSAGGWPRRILAELAEHYPISLHATSLSLVSAEPLNQTLLHELKLLADLCQPCLISEHLAWCAIDGLGFPDLLPAPLTEESLAIAAQHIDAMQTALGRQILIENPSLYGRLAYSTIPEPEFLRALTQQTGCGLLVDVNNIIVSATNLDYDPIAYLDALPLEAVGEVHLSGHARQTAPDGEGKMREIRIDDHGSPVSEPVWELARHLLQQTGAKPLLVEWDRNLPPLPRLLEEASKADQILAELGT